VLFVLAVVLFGYLVHTTTILRDPNAPHRPDDRPPYSLARMQMAFWFFLVITAWFLLFLITKDMDTLTSSVLVLLGISAATAVGSAVIDAGTAVEGAERMKAVPLPDQEKDLVGRVNTLKQSLDEARARPMSADQRAEVARTFDELTVAKRQKDFFGRNAFRKFMSDILGDNGNISFHRFQIAMWTLVLGIVFVIHVFGELAMPEFSATILGLMGISSGTFLGFKLPAVSAQGKS
jgi:hypothetical protein